MSDRSQGPTPRISPTTEVDADTAELLRKTAMRDGEPFTVFRTLAHHPRLLRRFNAFAGALMSEPLLPVRERELVVLRVGWNTGAVYEFGQHTLIARTCGVTDEEITRITRGELTFWSPEDRLLLALADELCTTDDVSEPTWAGLARRWSVPQLLELVMLVGCYRAVAGLVNAVGVELDDGVPGWPDGAPDTRESPWEGPHGRLVRSYFSACNDGTVEEIAAHFTPDAVVYDTNHAPVRGAEAIGRFWTRTPRCLVTGALVGRRARRGSGRGGDRVDVDRAAIRSNGRGARVGALHVRGRAHRGAAPVLDVAAGAGRQRARRLPPTARPNTGTPPAPDSGRRAGTAMRREAPSRGRRFSRVSRRPRNARLPQAAGARSAGRGSVRPRPGRPCPRARGQAPHGSASRAPGRRRTAPPSRLR